VCGGQALHFLRAKQQGGSFKEGHDICIYFSESKRGFGASLSDVSLYSKGE
jgi:hypothetical protein